jgi:hypothetical protein
MSAYGFSSPAATNNKPSGIASIVTDIATGTAHSQTLTDLKDGKFTQTHLFEKNQTGMERVHAIQAEASWKYMITNGSNVQLLSTWAQGFHNTALNLVNADVVVFGNSTVGHNGVPKWRLVVEGGPQQARYVEMMLKRIGVVGSATASVYDNDILWSTFTSAGDTALFAAQASRSSSGMKTFAVRNTGESNFEVIGSIKNCKFYATLDCDEDEEGRYTPRGTISIEYSVDVMDFTPTSLAVLDTFHQVASNDVQFKLMEELLISCVDNLGAVADPTLDGDADKGAIMRFHGSGIVTLANWAGLFSGGDIVP